MSITMKWWFVKHFLLPDLVSAYDYLLVVDEDVPGGASAHLLDAVLNGQGAWNVLDGQAQTLTAKPHLPAYGSDGDYFSKPSLEDIVETAYNVMREVDPTNHPSLR